MMECALIEGYAAIFDEPDKSGDVIRRGAFRRMIAKGSRDVRMLFQHLPSMPIGRWLDLVEDHHGLFVRGELCLDSPRAKETWHLLRGRALDGLSIGFVPRRARRRKAGRELLDIELWEVSVVTFPMAPAARIIRVSPEPLPPALPASAVSTRLQHLTETLQRERTL